jgi:hypothetical protein
MSFQIVKGDYGRIFRGIVEDEDYSDCTAKIYLWTGTTKILDGKSCVVLFHSPDTWVDYTPALADFSTLAPGTYSGLIKFEKAGVVERTIPFTWDVIDKEPA